MPHVYQSANLPTVLNDAQERPERRLSLLESRPSLLSQRRASASTSQKNSLIMRSWKEQFLSTLSAPGKPPSSSALPLPPTTSMARPSLPIMVQSHSFSLSMSSLLWFSGTRPSLPSFASPLQPLQSLLLSPLILYLIPVSPPIIAFKPLPMQIAKQLSSRI